MSHASLDHAPRRGSLLRAELHRFRTRRMVRAVLLATLLVLVAGAVALFTQFANPTAADLAQANARIDQNIAQSQQYLTQCQAVRTTGDRSCGSPPQRSNYQLRYYLDHQPFDLGAQYADGAITVGFAVGAVAFLLGVTFVGAEWSQRSMVALLFWEPRRTVVLSRKLAVATLAGAGLALLGQLAWLGLAHLMGALRGSSAVPDGFGAAVLGQGARLVLLGALLGLAGAGLANLVRGTGAALGIAFGYLVLVETSVRALGGASQQWLLSTAALGLGSRDGTIVHVPQQTPRPDGSVAFSYREIVVSGLHSGLLLGGITVLVVAVGSVLLVRRDLQ